MCHQWVYHSHWQFIQPPFHCDECHGCSTEGSLYGKLDGYKRYGEDWRDKESMRYQSSNHRPHIDKF